VYIPSPSPLLVDPTGSGVLQFRDFERAMAVKMRQKDSKEELLKAFKLFTSDADGSGKVC